MKKNLIGALALSAALALGTVGTAFADPAAVVQGNATDNTSDTAIVNTQDNGANTGEGNGNTDVYLQAISNQVNATIPLRVYTVADIDGGAMVTPDKSAYKITNNSTAGALYVTQVQSTLDTGWTGSNIDPMTLAAPGEKMVYMTLKADEAADAITLTSASPITTVTPTAPAKSLWSIAKKSGTDGTASEIQLAGANSSLGSDIDTTMTYENNSAVKFMTITYTVSMKAHDLTTA